MGAAPDDMTLKDGHAIAGNRRVPLGELAREGLAVRGKTRPGAFVPGYSQASHGSQFAEVAVNAVTGEVRVRRMLGVFDCGRVLNRKTARSQLLGGMIWGIGSALHEDAVADARTGQYVNPDFGDYHIASHADAPPIAVHFIEEPDRHANPHGVKGTKRGPRCASLRPSTSLGTNEGRERDRQRIRPRRRPCLGRRADGAGDGGLDLGLGAAPARLAHAGQRRWPVRGVGLGRLRGERHPRDRGGGDCASSASARS